MLFEEWWVCFILHFPNRVSSLGSRLRSDHFSLKEGRVLGSQMSRG